MSPTNGRLFLEQAANGCTSGKSSEWPQYRPSAQWALDKIDELQSIVDKLKKTEEGDPIIPTPEGEYPYWCIFNESGEDYDPRIISRCRWCGYPDGENGSHEAYQWCVEDALDVGAVESVYSTREAAEAALKDVVA